VNSDRRWQKWAENIRAEKKKETIGKAKRKLGTTWCKKGGSKNRVQIRSEKRYTLLVRTLMNGGGK